MFSKWKQRTATRANTQLIAGSTIGAIFLVSLAMVPGCGSKSSTLETAADIKASRGLPEGSATLAQVTRGRYLVVSAGCSDCHNRSVNNPADPKWLSGYHAGTPGQPFQIGPWQTYPANITSDKATGIGEHSDRQIYNALKHGLDPEDTADVVITGDKPGIGNFPSAPHYLAPPMPWTATRHLTDDDLWAMVAYLKHGTKAVNNKVPETTGPPTTWAGAYSDATSGPATLPDFPAASEQFSP